MWHIFYARFLSGKHRFVAHKNRLQKSFFPPIYLLVDLFYLHNWQDKLQVVTWFFLICDVVGYSCRSGCCSDKTIICLGKS